MRAAVLAGGLLVVLSGGAMAGTVITLDQSISGEPNQQQTIALTADKLKMTTPDNQMIYRGDQNKVWMIRPEDKAYVELTPESMGQMKSQMDQAMARMQQQMAAMPPEQRKRVEAMMASRGMGPSAGAAPPQIHYEKAGDAKKIGGSSCPPYHVTLSGGGPASEFCMASLSDLGLTRDDLKSFTNFGKFMSQMGGVGAQRSPMAHLDLDSVKQQIGFDGFPVQTTFAPDGKHTIQTTLVSIKHEDPPAATFDLPAGYKREDMGPGMGHGPRRPE